MKNIKLVLADVDGTLVTQNKELTPEAINAVAALRKAGIQFAITSGRPPRGMAMLTGPLKMDVPVAGFNGGVFAHPDLSVMETRTIKPDYARDALKLVLDSGLDAWVYTPDEWLIRDPKAAHVAKEASTVQFDASVVEEFTDEHLAHCVKIVGISDDLDLVEATEKKAQDMLGNHVTAARSQPYYLDITHPDANKGAVVRALSKMLHIPTDQIATFGDQPNDVAMFKASGFSVAMGNAKDAVKQQASATTGSNEENGFADAIRKLILEQA